jgi:hypothetical protein
VREHVQNRDAVIPDQGSHLLERDVHVAS